MRFIGFPKRSNVNRLRKYNIGILGNLCTSVSSGKFLSKFLKTLTPLTNEIFVINDGYPQNSDDKIHIIKIRYVPSRRMRPLNYVTAQILQCIHLIRLHKKINILFVLQAFMLLPIMIAKILGKKTMVMIAQDVIGFGSRVYSHFLRMIKILLLELSDYILVESPNIALSWKLDKYKAKVCIGAVYVDLHSFRAKRRIGTRPNTVGYVGNLIERKGVSQLALAICKILKKSRKIRFLIVGRGPLEDQIKSLADEYPTEVKYIESVPEVDLPNVLNEMKILVLPSYTEGLPNIVLEAMACGTPVLATPVGAIPDVIRDRKSGFILKNNSPEVIAVSISDALTSPDLREISKNSRNSVEKEYSYNAALDRYRRILCEANN